MVDRCDSVEEQEWCQCVAKMCPIVYMNESRDKLESCYMDLCFISKRALEYSALIKPIFVEFGDR
ncbi:hypothetical protein Tcan_02012 [Toxocara canis]|uniref:Uncharacterized protein n=1 Tax=Toxocara canis TaxID=6265 RepID=A0A0B2W0B8_TOXCA|nr:hypothetical protein Tcan_02012 [Toxocara canis]